MLFENHKLYKQARASKLRKVNLPRPLEELRSWASEKFGVNVLLVVYEFIKHESPQGSPNLNLILETTEQYHKLHEDYFTVKPLVEKDIRRKFEKILSESPIGAKYETTGLFVTFDDFSKEAMNQAARRFRSKDAPKLTRRLKQDKVWEITGFSFEIVVFYLTDNQVGANKLNGTSDRIKKQCYDLVKQYDEFDYYKLDTFPILFDSKQNLDENYDGNLFYYFK